MFPLIASGERSSRMVRMIAPLGKLTLLAGGDACEDFASSVARGLSGTRLKPAAAPRSLMTRRRVLPKRESRMAVPFLLRELLTAQPAARAKLRGADARAQHFLNCRARAGSRRRQR